MHKLFVSLAALAACGPPPEKPVDAMPDTPDNVTRTDVLSLPATVTRDVDVLVMVDDSPSTLDKTEKLKASFPAFIATIDALPNGRPNLHLGVVTSDVGTLDENGVAATQVGNGVGMCKDSGKAGLLQTQGTPLVSGKYISDIATTGGRDANYTGTLADAFSAIASVGATGCGFEQPLHAVHLALTSGANPGFLRSDANLVVLMLSDEDDCSMAHSALLGNDPGLGPLQSFRCTQFGVICDTGGMTSDLMAAVGVKAACHSSESSPYLANVADYVTFLKGLKTDPRNVMVGALVGDPDKVEIEMRAPPSGGPAQTAVKHACKYTNAQQTEEVADPAVRLGELAGQFQHHVVSSVCGDLEPGLADIGRQLASLQGSACLTRAIAQPANCVVVDETAAGVKTTLPACPRDGHDCFSIVGDSAACPGLQNLKLEVTRGAAPDPTTVTTVSCAL